jgi:hypothetical protein
VHVGRGINRHGDQADRIWGEPETRIRLARRMCRSSLGSLAFVEMDETIAVIDYEMKIAKYIKTKITGDLRFRIIS